MLHDRAYVLHKKPYKDSSELIKIFSQHHGVVDVLGKGSRGPKSKFKGQLQPFIECEVSFTGRSALQTLVSAEQPGAPFKTGYTNHVAMLYCNELLLLSNYHDEANQAIYHCYAQTIDGLKSATSVALLLRRFEWQLYCAMGYELTLPQGAKDQDHLAFDSINGLGIKPQSDQCTVAVFRLFTQGADLSAEQLKPLNRLMRGVINHLVHGKTIQSRALLKARPAERPSVK
ncbi:DNA repair protein RecO [Marinicella meishanensis]|uniref:DNA repair protein RecO n=1 Tax=Marinicella meishanensis TaxID=2873263 RepID=UPI001CBAA7ED|nr:DNA repair protein RecO [Marinicella sp. NBU2979]